jgi:hypothetical protein
MVPDQFDGAMWVYKMLNREEEVVYKIAIESKKGEN